MPCVWCACMCSSMGCVCVCACEHSSPGLVCVPECKNMHMYVWWVPGGGGTPAVCLSARMCIYECMCICMVCVYTFMGVHCDCIRMCVHTWCI